MSSSDPPKSSDENGFDAVSRALSKEKQPEYVLRLYITGTTTHSTRAIVNVRRLCETYLGGRVQLEIIDLLKQPARASQAQIIASPTLVKERPLPLRRFIGDLSNTSRLLAALDLAPQKNSIWPAKK